ncbi:MAG: hypothetical protein SFU86_19590 [Pirellulaceae bacterium]|nr:hypothetical protein [Pirellulaceae bacterium]
MAISTGCQLPAIDPTGARIFSGTTTLAWQDLLDCPLLGHKQDGPAAPAGAAIQPPCNPPVEVVPVVPTTPAPVFGVPAKQCSTPIVPVGCGPGQTICQPPQSVPQTPLAPRLQITNPTCPQEEKGPILKVTPSRIVAPVNSEVVLAAGICDGNGYYVMRQPLEFMLAQDGVGQLVQVGKESPFGASYILRMSPQKVATNYARVHTSTIQQCLDRGTKSTADDVFLEKGQSWITVTSPTEGTSHVVVWAPKEQNWERRKTTATIYWVDAVWQFPPAAQGRAGQKQILSTSVARSGGAPVSGWTVRYEIVDGPDAAFTARGDTAIEVKTDAAGRATVELLPRSTQPGITLIKMQIIRPGSTRGDVPQMIVGQGQTAVSWNSPGLQVTAVGPSTVAADGAVGYRVEVTNSGDLPTRGVTLSYTPPTGVTLLNSNPAAQAFGQRYEWRIGDLPARTTSVVELNCRAAVAADLRSCFRARSGDGLEAEGCATTRVFANALSVKLSGPDTVEVGREAKFLVEITNTGTTALSNVTVSDTFDPGLQHLQGERSPIVQARAASLAPGQVDRFAVSFLVVQPGRHCHRMDVSADGGQRASARACVTGLSGPAPAPSPVPGPAAAPAELGLRVTGPASRRAGEVAEYFVELTNSGGSSATNVRISVQYGVNLQLKEASRGHRDDLRRLTTEWQVAQLAPGETLTKQLNCLCLNPDDRASVRATVSSDQTGIKTAEFLTQISPGAAPAVERPVSPPPVAVEPPAAGNLKVTIADIGDPIRIGEKTTYLIEVTNERAVSDKEVIVTLQMTDGLKPVGATGPAGIASVGPDGTLVLSPVNEIRAGEKLSFKVEVSGAKAGKQKTRVTIKSTRTPEGVAAETDTTVNMQ